MRKFLNILLLLLLHANFFASAQTDLHTIQICEQSSELAAYKALAGQSFIQCDFKTEFCTKELMNTFLNAGIVKNSNALTCLISHYGYSQFGELQLQLGYARNFGHKLGIALQGIYLMKHAAQYKIQHSLTVDLSFAYQISRNLFIAVDLYNPIRMKYGVTGDEIIPMEFHLQTCYHKNDKISATLFCKKTLPGHLDLGLELGYRPLSFLIISGNCTNRKCGIGIHITWKKIVFCIRSDWYYRISFSPESDILFIL